MHLQSVLLLCMGLHQLERRLRRMVRMLRNRILLLTDAAGRRAMILAMQIARWTCTWPARLLGAQADATAFMVVSWRLVLALGYGADAADALGLLLASRSVTFGCL